MSGATGYSKGDRKRTSTPTDKQATAKGMGCGWCEFWLAIKKKCIKDKDERCPKDV